jgi:hypothetical protein
MSFDPKEKLPGAPYTTLSPQLQQLFVAERPDLNELQLAGSERYALADGRPARWTANGWVPVSGPLGSLDPTTLFAPDDIEGQRGLHKLQVDRDGALWAFGGYHAAYAARFAGADWTAIAVEPRPGGFDGSPAHVWAAPSGEIWLNTTFDIRRYSGSGFQIYDLPVASGTTGSGFYGLSGFADGRVLVARTVTGPSSQYESVIYQIDGSQTTESLTLNDTADFYIATFAPDRALIIRSDGTPFAFDGSNWTTPDWTKPPIPGLWAPATRLGRVVARDVDDLFVLADDPRGSHVFHFDGKTWEVLFSADRLSSIAMDGNALWVVGPKGATARTTLHDPAK